MKKNSKVFSILKKIFFVFLIFILIITAGLAYLVIDTRQKYTTDVIENYQPLTPSIIYDINGKQIDLITIENRDPIDISEIPVNVQNAFIAVEDKRFRKHHGLDFIRLTKAFMLNVTGTGREGGSTITQQLVKTAFLTSERSILKRKLPEAILAIEMERRFTKDEILENYLNTINFGRGAYGIKNASIKYFAKLPKDLSIAEGAILASMPKSPVKYSKKENALERQKIILKMMYNNGFITSEEYEAAKVEEINFIPTNDSDKTEEQRISTSNLAPEFTTIVLSEMKRILNIDEENNKALFGGYKIYATVDINMQKAAYKAFETNTNMKKRKDLQGALISIDPANGFVKAMVGGKGYVKGDFNRALNAKRQPGSSFKPIVYLAALQQNYPMSLTIEDSPFTVSKWSPKNYDWKFRGSMSLLRALEVSDNIVAVKTLQKVGIEAVEKIWKDAGVQTTDFPKDLTLSLGSITTSPIDMGIVYSAFANGGNKVTPHFIYKIENKFGEIVYEAKIEKEKIYEEEDVALITHMMESVVNHGTGQSAKIYQKGKMLPIAGKTGTTSDYVSAWFTGYSPTLTTIVYVGNDDNKSMGRGMSAGAAAIPIWKNYMQSVVNLPNYDVGTFEFIDKGLAKGTLVKRNIDLKIGLLDSDGVNSRVALFKAGTEPVEHEAKYVNGIVF